MKRLLARMLGKREPEVHEEVVVVSGLPRSGTSMMMKMLEAGGIPVLVDHLREPDVDNPRGYYEFERVKKLRDGDVAWVPEARGRVVKVISELLKWLPEGHRYRVVFMRRDMDEVLRSQKKMLKHRKTEGEGPSDDEMARLFEAHLAQVESWLAGQPHMDVLYVSYSELLQNPTGPVASLNRFFAGRLDEDRMKAVVDPSLYRSGA